MSTQPSEGDEDALKRLLSKSIWETVEHDRELFACGLNEVATVAPIYARMHAAGITGYDIDFEYDHAGRDGANKHLAPGLTARQGSIRPDIIIHRRGCSDRNLLVVEVKLRSDSEADRVKVRETMAAKQYRFGVTVVLQPGPQGEPHWRWFNSPSSSPSLEPVPR